MPSRDELLDLLLSQTTSKVPTSKLVRWRGTASAILGSGRLMWKARGASEHAELDPALIAKVVSSIGELKGITMKSAQLMSYIEIAMPEELRAALSVLQTHAQPMALEQVQTLIARDLPRSAALLLEHLSPAPIAAASIGQVHTSRLPDGTKVAVKVRYPGIDKAIINDFGVASASTRIVTLLFPQAKVDAFIAEAKARFLEECDYEHEALAQMRFADLYRGDMSIFVPDVYPEYCGPQVLTTTFVEGCGFDAFLAKDPSQAERDRVGETLFRFYLGTLFRHGLYNCDPHPGNYLFLPDGRVAVLDYGCTRAFDDAFLGKLKQLTRAVHEDTREALHAAFTRLEMVQEGRRYDFETARSLMRAFYGPMLHDQHGPVNLGAVSDMREVIKTKQKLLKLALPGEFLFLLRIRFGLMSVLARMGSKANWYRLEKSYV